LTSRRFRLFAISGVARMIAPPPSLMTQQSQADAAVGDHRRVEDVFDCDDVFSIACGMCWALVRAATVDPGHLLAGGAVLVHVRIAAIAYMLAVAGA